VLVHRLARVSSRRVDMSSPYVRGPAPSDANYRPVRLLPRLRGESGLLQTVVVPLLQNTVGGGRSRFYCTYMAMYVFRGSGWRRQDPGGCGVGRA
jgi:hypothetical protein